MGTKIEYKGPSVHEFRLSQKDLENADVQFGDYKMKNDLVWASGSARKAVFLPDDMPAEVVEQIVEAIKPERTFTIKQGDDVVDEADPNADKVNPDGSNKATGQGGSPVLSRALGEQAKNPVNTEGETPGGDAGSTTTSTRTSTTGGSTADR